jgi:hypothetical protein
MSVCFEFCALLISLGMVRQPCASQGATDDAPSLLKHFLKQWFRAPCGSMSKGWIENDCLKELHPAEGDCALCDFKPNSSL